MGFMIGPQLAAGCIIANTIALLLGALKPQLAATPETPSFFCLATYPGGLELPANSLGPFSGGAAAKFCAHEPAHCVIDEV
jgi:hypothetical protein